LLGYTFVPANGLVLTIFTATPIVWLAISAIKNRHEKTKTSVVFSALLPLIAIFFIISKWIASEIIGVDTYIYIASFCITLICSMIVFFSCGRGKAVKIGLGITYTVLVASIFFILFMWVFFFTFFNLSSDTVVKSEISPNAVYLAEIIDNDQGALGGATIVNVTRRNRNINILIGELKKDPQMIYYGRWGEFENMTLRWETDKIL